MTHACTQTKPLSHACMDQDSMYMPFTVFCPSLTKCSLLRLIFCWLSRTRLARAWRFFFLQRCVWVMCCLLPVALSCSANEQTSQFLLSTWHTPRQKPRSSHTRKTAESIAYTTIMYTRKYRKWKWPSNCIEMQTAGILVTFWLNRNSPLSKVLAYRHGTSTSDHAYKYNLPTGPTPLATKSVHT